MRLTLFITSFAVLGACTAESTLDQGTFTKADARRGEASGEASAKADGWDFCDYFGWYGDGECDDFCPRPDPDCSLPELELCASDADCPGGYCATFATCLAIGCPPPPPPQCLYPDCGDGTQALCDMEPPTCAAGQTVAVIDGCYACVEARTCALPEPPECSPVLCRLFCPYGFAKDENGCEFCSCAPPPPNNCQVGGCSGQLCYDPDVDSGISTCEWRPQYACFATATCERQPNNNCGWTPTPELNECIASAQL